MGEPLAHRGTPRLFAAIGLLASLVMSIWWTYATLKVGVVFISLVVGAFHILTFVSILLALSLDIARARRNWVMLIAAGMAMPMAIYAFGWLAATVVPFYRASGIISFYLEFGIMLIEAISLLIVVPATMYYRIPRWVLGLALFVSALWLCTIWFPTVIRGWYGTYIEPSELLPRGALILDRPNPERTYQKVTLTLGAIVWTIALTGGRFRWRVVRSEQVARRPEQLQHTTRPEHNS